MTDTSVMSIFTVYAKPRDYPQEYVCREFRITGAGLVRASALPLVVAPTLERCCAPLIARGLTRLERNPEDDACVVCSYV